MIFKLIYIFYIQFYIQLEAIDDALPLFLERILLIILIHYIMVDIIFKLLCFLSNIAKKKNIFMMFPLSIQVTN